MSRTTFYFFAAILFIGLILLLAGCSYGERAKQLHEINRKLDSLTVEFDKAEKLKLLERFNKQGDIIIMKMKLINKGDSIIAGQ